MKQELKNKLNWIVKELSKNKKVMAIYLFGSQATGKARKDSDVDIAVLIKNASKKEESYISRLNHNNFDVHSFTKLPLIIQHRVLSEGKLIFVRDEEFVKIIWLKTIREYLDFQPFIDRFYKRVIENV